MPKKKAKKKPEEPTPNVMLWGVAGIVIAAGAMTTVLLLKRPSAEPMQVASKSALTNVVSTPLPAPTSTVVSTWNPAIASGNASAASNASALGSTSTNEFPGTNEFGEVEVDVDKSTDHLVKGNQFLADKKWAEAVREFRLSVRFNPEDEDLYYNLGLALSQQGEVAEAKTNYLKALDLFPDYVEAHNNLGNLFVKEGNYPEATKHFEAALQADETSASAHNNLGTALARQKRTAESINHFEEAVRLKPDYPEAQFNLGNAYLLTGRVEEAEAEFMKLLNAHPDFPKAREQWMKAKARKNPEAK